MREEKRRCGGGSELERANKQQEKSPRSAAEKNTASAGSPRGSPAAAAVAPQRRANGGHAGAPLAAMPGRGQGEQATPPTRQRSAPRRGREHTTRLAVAAACTLHSPVPTTTTSLHSSLCTVGAGGRTPCSAVAIVAGGRCLLQPNMLPFETPSIFDQLPRFVFKMPRVVPDQKAKFESDELFRRLSRECEIRYTGYRDRPLEERQVRFQNACREGHTEVAFVATGTNLQLVFSPCHNGYVDCCDFDKERGKIAYVRRARKEPRRLAAATRQPDPSPPPPHASAPPGFSVRFNCRPQIPLVFFLLS
ncbi:hypothetical protein HPB52_016034 [Rhipicephalus sanguineus]|uniref:Uncharacterized protein n=1 Tax=Rhipicephalus sanguineus TaxID=34632 RepID=A0A9D4TAP8_RHISA|nr:hypothetical protein HPB52_016034 [Rhipicephalus sanguineus]